MAGKLQSSSGVKLHSCSGVKFQSSGDVRLHSCSGVKLHSSGVKLQSSGGLILA